MATVANGNAAETPQQQPKNAEQIVREAQGDPTRALELAIAENERLRLERQAEVRLGAHGLEATTLSALARVAKVYWESGLTPKGFQNEKAVLIAMAHGAELGLTPLQAIQTIAVINGKPSIYGDAAKALIVRCGVAEYIREFTEGEPGTDAYAWVCETKRKGGAVEQTRFSVKDAKQAKLWGKEGPWTFYPDRMLMFRARGFRLRDTYPDVLKGMLLAEEAGDIDAPANPYSAPAEAAPERGSNLDALAARLGGEEPKQPAKTEEPKQEAQPPQQPAEAATVETVRTEPDQDERERQREMYVADAAEAIRMANALDDLSKTVSTLQVAVLDRTITADDQRKLLALVGDRRKQLDGGKRRR